MPSPPSVPLPPNTSITLALIGDGGVGKTSLLTVHCQGAFLVSCMNFDETNERGVVTLQTAVYEFHSLTLSLLILLTCLLHPPNCGLRISFPNTVPAYPFDLPSFFFFANADDPTIEEVWASHETFNGSTIRVDYIDTAGQEEFAAMREESLRSANAILLCFDLTNIDSFRGVARWHSEIIRSTTDEGHGPSKPIVLVGTKSDLRETNAAVLFEEAEAMAQSLGVPYVETSALKNLNVKHAFQAAVNLALAPPESTQIPRKMPKGTNSQAVGHQAAVTAQASAVEPGLIISGDAAGELRVWARSQCRAIIRGGHKTAILAIYSLKMPFIVSVSSDAVCAWPSLKKSEATVETVSKPTWSVNPEDPSSPIQDSALGKDVVCFITSSGRIYGIDPKDGSTKFVHKSDVKTTRLGMAGRDVVLGCSDGSLKVVPAAPFPESPFSISGPQGAITALISVSDSLVCAGAADGSIWMVDAQTKTASRSTSKASAAITFLLLTSKGLLVLSDDRTARLFSTDTSPKQIAVIDHTGLPAGFKSATASPSHYFLAAPDGRVCAFDSNTNAPSWDWTLHDSAVSCLSIIPQTGALISGGADGRIKVIDPFSGSVKDVKTDPGTRLQQLWGPRLAALAVTLSLILDFLQLSSFPFSLPDDVSLPWARSNPAVSILPVFLLDVDFDTLLPSLGQDGFELSLLLIVFLYLVCFASSFKLVPFQTAFSVQLDPWRGGKLWFVVKAIVLVGTTFAFLPAARALLSIVLNADWLLLKIISVCVLIPYVLLVVRLIPVGGDLAKVSTYHWWSWRFDRPPSEKKHQLSKQDAGFSRIELLVKILMLGSVVQPGLLTSSAVVTVLLVGSMILLVATFHSPPFHTTFANSLRFATLAGVVWTNITSLVVIAVNDSNNASTTVLHLGIMPVFCFFGAAAMIYRSRILAQSQQRRRSSILSSIADGSRDPRLDEDADGTALASVGAPGQATKFTCEACHQQLPAAWKSMHNCSQKDPSVVKQK